MLILLCIWLICIIASDWRHRRVPNVLVLTGAALALLALMTGLQPFALTWSSALMAAGIGFAAMLIFYALGLMGAADVKFVAALGLWLGSWSLLWVWIGASLLAALHSLVLIAWRGRTQLPRLRRREIPYAAHLAAVTIGWLIWQNHA